MSWLSSLFSKERKSAPRQLTHPNQLGVKDMIQLSDSFALPSQLREQMLEVKQINTIEFEHQQVAEYLLENKLGDQIFLSIEEDDRDWLNFSLKLKPEQVETLFDLDEFGGLFEADAQIMLHRKETDALEQWHCPEYRQQVNGQMGYFHRKDYRGQKPPQHEGAGEAFQYFMLGGDDEAYSVEIEVWEDGETDVMLTYSRPLTDIRDYFPGS